MKTLILASTSPRRKELMNILQLPFRVEAPGYEEDMTLSMPPVDLAKYLSLGKAQAVAHRHTNAIIIAADSFVIVSNKVLGKPKNAEEAKKMLEIISGTRHTIVTGFTVIDTDTGKIISEGIEATVFFKQLSTREISAYVATKEPLDKAGAYAIQGLGAIFIERIEGDFYGAVGLPIKRVAEIVNQFGIPVL